jgi:hypothetical protein
VGTPYPLDTLVEVANNSQASVTLTSAAVTFAVTSQTPGTNCVTGTIRPAPSPTSVPPGGRVTVRMAQGGVCGHNGASGIFCDWNVALALETSCGSLAGSTTHRLVTE